MIMEEDDLAKVIIDAGRWIARMHMTAGRRPYREVGQFGQVVGVVSPQPSTGARSTGGDIRNDKLQRRYEVTSTIASILDWLGATPDRTDRDPRNHAPRPIHVLAVASQGWVTRDPGLADVWVGHGWRGG